MAGSYTPVVGWERIETPEGGVRFERMGCDFPQNAKRQCVRGQGVNFRSQWGVALDLVSKWVSREFQTHSLSTMRIEIPETIGSSEES